MKMKQNVFVWVLSCLCAWALISGGLTPGSSRGAAQVTDRNAPVELLLVNMTPDPVTDAQRTCSRRLRRHARSQRVHLHALGETATRAAAQGPEDYLLWGTSELERVRAIGQGDGRPGYDVVLLFDCRPELQQANALVFRTGGSIKHLRIRDVEFERAGAVRWFAEGVFRGFL